MVVQEEADTAEAQHTHTPDPAAVGSHYIHPGHMGTEGIPLPEAVAAVGSVCTLDSRQ